MHTRLAVPGHGVLSLALRTLTILLAVLALALVAGCSGGGSGGPATTDVQITLDFSGSATGALRLSLPAGLGSQRLAATVDDVASVTVDVYDGATPLVVAEPAVEGSPGVWTVTLTDLPVGVLLTFTAHAYDITPAEIFSGSTSFTLSGGDDTVTIVMAPTPAPPQALPRIVSIQVPTNVTPNTSADVTFLLEGNPDELLDWVLTTGGGAFTPTLGQIPLSGSGTASLVVSYTAPATPGWYTHTMRVTNEQGNAVEAGFDILVASGTAGIVLKFVPVVTSILGSRLGDTVTWTATVVDDGATFGYAWSADVAGGTAPAFRSPPDTNPAYLDGYDETVDGTLTLQVTDADSLSTTVTILLPAGQFPDNLVVNPGAGLTYVDGDGVPEITDVPTLAPAPFGPGDTVTISVPVDSDVGYLAACVSATFLDAADMYNSVDRGCTSEWSRTPALGVATHDLVLDGVLPASDEYWVLVITCSTMSNCDAFTGTLYTSDNGGSTYARQEWVDATPLSSVDTGVPIPTYSSPGGSLGFQAVNGDGVAEMTDVPVPATLTISIATDTSMVIDVPVDGDAGSVCVDIGAGYNLGSGFPGGTEGTGCADVTPGAPQTVPVTVIFGALTEGPHTMTVSVGLEIPGPDNTDTSWNYASTKNPGTFRVVKYLGSPVGTEFETGAPIPVIDVGP